MVRRPDKPQSQRQLRVGEELRHALAWVLERGELRDPDLVGRSVTVTEVRISPDLHKATAFVVQLGGGDAELVVAALTRARPFLRGQIAKSVKLRHVPELSFQIDESFDTYSHIDSLLRMPNVARDLQDDDEDAFDDQDED